MKSGIVKSYFYSRVTIAHSCTIPVVSTSLVILGCSQRKIQTDGALPAINRYDGPVFRVIRRYLREDPGKRPEIYVLSGKFGLIEASTRIPHYDEKLDPAGCDRLRPQINRTLRDLVCRRQFDEILIVASKLYVKLLLQSLLSIGATVRVFAAPPGNGPPLTCLHGWLRGERMKKHEPRLLIGDSQCP